MTQVKFSKSDLDLVDTAVKKAESKTSGEIVTAIIKESYDYAASELIFSLLGGFLYFMIMLFFIPSVETFLQGLFWDYSVHYVVFFYGFSTFILIGLLYVISNSKFIDRLVIPKKVMKLKVHQRALRHFIESGVSQTKDRTGILIFISLLEQRVEILADRGIGEKISGERWNDLVEDLITGIKAGKVTEKLCETISRCGIILEEHFPISVDDVNELSDQIELLET